jgi:translocation and assembly module TamA
MLMLKTGAILLFILLAPSLREAAASVDVVIQGIQGEPLQNAQISLALPYGIIQNGTVNTFWLERFTREAPDKVRQALEPYGYYQAGVKADLKRTGENSYQVLVTVAPGPPVRISEVKVSVQGPGSSEEPLRKLVNSFPLKQGDVLLQTAYERAKSELGSKAAELGYLDAAFTIHTIIVDPDRSTAFVELVLETGPRYRFGDVTFAGTAQYSEPFLKRYLSFGRGDVFSFAELGETQLNLINSERFTEVFPVPQKEKADEDRVPVLIRLKEAPTKRLRPGIGYETDIGVRFSLQYRDLNIFGRGHEFRTELNLSRRLQSLGSEYRLPDPRDIDSYTGLQVNFRREDLTTYTNQNLSTEINRTRSFRRGRVGTVYLRFEREDATIASENLESRLVLPGARYSQRRYDSLIRPSRGYQYGIDVRGTNESMGSTIRFLQVLAESTFLAPLPWRLSLLTRVRAGATFQEAPISQLPVSYRFFAGGDRSVRGYAYQSLGPVAENGQVTGGKDVLVGGVELDRALSASWGVAAFYDAGNAFNSFDEIHLFQGAGLGVRYYTVLGALRLDVARQIAVADPSYRIHFTVGYAF